MWLLSKVIVLYNIRSLKMNIRALGLVGYHHTISSLELHTNNSSGGMICKLLRSNPGKPEHSTNNIFSRFASSHM